MWRWQPVHRNRVCSRAGAGQQRKRWPICIKHARKARSKTKPPAQRTPVCVCPPLGARLVSCSPKKENAQKNVQSHRLSRSRASLRLWRQRRQASLCSRKYSASQSGRSRSPHGCCDAHDPYKNVTLGNSAGGVDFFGFDNFSVGGSSQAAPTVPEPPRGHLNALTPARHDDARLRVLCCPRLSPRCVPHGSDGNGNDEQARGWVFGGDILRRGAKAV